MTRFVTKTEGKSREEAVQEQFAATGNAAGFCSRALIEGETTIGYELVDLKSGRTVLCAMLPDRIPSGWNEELQHGKYSFSREGFAFAETIIDKALEDGATVLFLDEIGKLELKDSGFASLLQRCAASGSELVIGCRRANIAKIREQFLTE
ncbi:nucleoside-triphosphatase [Marispirochaeta sp.]|jgi:nucleoside-triphosphatase THEP1|uniref:nucleoside-triphosphatase n=1 Tax=Marispirochaeta sp. TaxID=2038653 RepID=UPI0029C92674|nr:nucleoside-triphosphatase [Marispirochaeta sp.]